MSSPPPAVAAGSSTSSSSRMVGEYVIQSEIGRGSFATVYLAKHASNGTSVAIKSVSKARLNRKVAESLEKEIEILRETVHPNIVRLLDIVKTDKHIYLMMEYCPLGDLSKLIRKRKALKEPVVRHLLRQLASALEFMRERSVIHRDLKPQNLLLSGSEDNLELKIADFGFARYMEPQDLAETLCGSPLYMAPEILRYEKYDAKADLWSVGCILYEALWGSPPFRASNHVELLRKIEQAIFPLDLSRYPGSNDIKSLISGLLRRDRWERMGFEEFFTHAALRPSSQSGTGASEAPQSSQHAAQPHGLPLPAASSSPDSAGVLGRASTNPVAIPERKASMTSTSSVGSRSASAGNRFATSLERAVAAASGRLSVSPHLPKPEHADGAAAGPDGLVAAGHHPSPPTSGAGTTPAASNRLSRGPSLLHTALRSDDPLGGPNTHSLASAGPAPSLSGIPGLPGVGGTGTHNSGSPNSMNNTPVFNTLTSRRGSTAGASLLADALAAVDHVIGSAPPDASVARRQWSNPRLSESGMRKTGAPSTPATWSGRIENAAGVQSTDFDKDYVLIERDYVEVNALADALATGGNVGSVRHAAGGAPSSLTHQQSSNAIPAMPSVNPFISVAARSPPDAYAQHQQHYGSQTQQASSLPGQPNAYNPQSADSSNMGIIAGAGNALGRVVYSAGARLFGRAASISDASVGAAASPTMGSHPHGSSTANSTSSSYAAPPLSPPMSSVGERSTSRRDSLAAVAIMDRLDASQIVAKLEMAAAASLALAHLAKEKSEGRPAKPDEALALYSRAAAVAAWGARLARKSSGPDVSVAILQAVQTLRDRYNELLTQAQQLQLRGRRASSNVVALVHEAAVASARDAAVDEALGYAPRARDGYARSIALLESLVVPLDNEAPLADADRRMIVEYTEKVRNRIAVLAGL